MICFSVQGKTPTRNEDQMVYSPPLASLKDSVYKVVGAVQPALVTRIVVLVLPLNDPHHEDLEGSIPIV